MRQLMVKIPAAQSETVAALARGHKSENVTFLEAAEGKVMAIINLPNQRVGALLDELEEELKNENENVEITLIPHAVLPLSPPAVEVASHIEEVQARSPVEIWLNAQQSVGSWPSFLSYALAGSIIVWIGMFTNTIYLLVAAMLVSPFAEPAMNSAVAAATGDKSLLRQSVGRYFISLGVMVSAAVALSLVLGLQTATETMVNTSEVSAVAVLLPLVAGATGALNLVQAENSSLVSGTAVGILVAASLAPPAGLIGMAAAIQRWDMVINGAFLLLLQLVAITLAGAFVFRIYKLTPQGSRFHRGQARYFYVALLVSGAVLACLLAWQFQDSPSLQRSTRAQRALAVADQVISDRSDVNLVEANFRFTRPEANSQAPEALLGIIYVEQTANTTLAAEVLSQDVAQAIQQRLLTQGFNVKPLLTVIVLEPPPSFQNE